MEDMIEVALLPWKDRGDCMKPHCDAKNVPLWHMVTTPKPSYLPPDPVLICDTCALMFVITAGKGAPSSFLGDINSEG